MSLLFFACATDPLAPPLEVGEEFPPLSSSMADRYALGARVAIGALAVWPVLDRRASTTDEYLPSLTASQQAGSPVGRRPRQRPRLTRSSRASARARAPAGPA